MDGSTDTNAQAGITAEATRVDDWRPSVNPWIIAVAAMLATLMEALDTSGADVALPGRSGRSAIGHVVGLRGHLPNAGPALSRVHAFRSVAQEGTGSGSDGDALTPVWFDSWIGARRTAALHAV
jgi:hypothetical protein